MDSQSSSWRPHPHESVVPEHGGIFVASDEPFFHKGLNVVEMDLHALLAGNQMLFITQPLSLIDNWGGRESKRREQKTHISTFRYFDELENRYAMDRPLVEEDWKKKRIDRQKLLISLPHDSEAKNIIIAA